MQNSTFKLTKEEFDFSSSQRYPELKHAVIAKISERLGHLGAELANSFEENPLSSHLHEGFKVTRGENYKMMPYVVCDIPRIRDKDFPFLFRTMFWWGHYYSFNVLVNKGTFDAGNLLQKLQHRGMRRLRVYTGDNLWQQDLSDKGFVRLRDLDTEALSRICSGSGHLRLGRKLAFAKDGQLEKRALKFYGLMLEMLETTLRVRP